MAHYLIFRGVVYMTEAGEDALRKHGVAPGLETFEMCVLSDDEFEAMREGAGVSESLH